MRPFSNWIAATAREAAWAPCLLLLSYAVLPKAFGLAHHIPQFDIYLHFLGGVAIAYFVHRGSINAVRFGICGSFRFVTHMVLVSLLVCAAAVLWELAEFTYDRIAGTQQQLGTSDTLVDLIMGLAGGAVFLAANWMTRKSSHSAGIEHD